MNCIDSVEGTVKSIIDRLNQTAIENRLDDTEFIRLIKAVIEASDAFIQNNREILATPEVLADVLYRYAKALWLARSEPEVRADPSLTEAERSEQIEYQHYYFDHIYAKGTYPR